MFSPRDIGITVILFLAGSLLLCASCGGDEPSAEPQRPGHITPTPGGGGGGQDPDPGGGRGQDPDPGGGGQDPDPGGGGESQPLTIVITPTATVRYAGDRFTLTAIPGREATVTWHSDNEDAVWVENDGAVEVEPIEADTRVTLTATARSADGQTAAADITINCRCWHLGWLDGDHPSTSAISTTPGSSVTLMLLDSDGQPIAGDTFNPSRCEWSVAPSTLAGLVTITAGASTAGVAVSATATFGNEFYIQARNGRAAAAQRLVVTF